MNTTKSMEAILEFFVLCDPKKRPVRLNRLPSVPKDALCYSALLPSPLPSQLLIFGLGDWSGLSGGSTVEVKLEGSGTKEHRLGTLTPESRCFLWESDQNPDTSIMLQEGKLHICMSVKGQVNINSTNRKKEHGKRKRIKEEEENVCPNSGHVKVPAQKQKNSSPKSPAPAKQLAHSKAFLAAPAVPTARWGQALCPVNSETVILIGGQGTRMQFCKDSMWKLNTDRSTWTPAEALADGLSPEARTGHTATFDPENNRIYVFGGSKNRKWFNDVHILDIEAWRWRSVEAQGKVPPLSYHTCSLFRGELFVFGGVFPRPNPEPDGCSNLLYIFDPQHEIWYQPIVLGKTPSSRSG
ncbi:hypothetical protein XENTR_v10011204 [Xenopus tropicalis]|nr:hypothetical protein XENTR_v10011204 [Xenopus tropicalis]